MANHTEQTKRRNERGERGGVTPKVMQMTALMFMPMLMLLGGLKLLKGGGGTGPAEHFFERATAVVSKGLETEATVPVATPTPEALPETFDLMLKGNSDGTATALLDGGDCQKWIESIPAGASVLADGKKVLGITPFVVQGTCGTKVSLRFVLAPYQTVTRAVVLEREALGLSVRLKKPVPIVKKDSSLKKTWKRLSTPKSTDDY